jgi:hypothetical protein
MLTVLTFKWRPAPGYRSTFGPDTVNTLYSMVRRNYSKPFKLVCLTDDPAGISPWVEVQPLWDDFPGVLPANYMTNYPVCYRRLRMFSKEVKSLLGERFVALDLDVVLTGDVTPLWSRWEDFVIYKGQNPTTPYNGSMVLMTTGSRSRVWEEFDPVKSPKHAASMGFFGSDQGWISACLGSKEKVFTKADGVYSFRNDLRMSGGKLPPNSRVVIFHGHADPWDRDIQRRHSWIAKHYR